MKVTLKNLNEKIANPLGVELVRGKGYFYLADLPETEPLMGYAETSMIYVFMLNQFTFEQWGDAIKELVDNANMLKQEARNVVTSQSVRLQWGK